VIGFAVRNEHIFGMTEYGLGKFLLCKCKLRLHKSVHTNYLRQGSYVLTNVHLLFDREFLWIMTVMRRIREILGLILR